MRSSIPDSPLIHVFDAAAAGVLPHGWQGELAEQANSAEMQVLEEHPRDSASGHGPWRFAVLTADLASQRLDWLWRLYHGAFRHFASERFDMPLYPANRRSATTTLNLLEGLGASNPWHRDANPVTGVFYGSTLAPDQGGQLQVRGVDGAVRDLPVRAGLFSCFAGSLEHRVAPLRAAVKRLAVPMTYYASVEGQPFANESDRYLV